MEESPFIRAQRLLHDEVMLLYSDTKVAELAACIERGPGFRHEEAHRVFKSDIYAWAIRYKPGQNYLSLGQILEIDAAKARDELATIQSMARNLLERIDSLLKSGEKALQIATNLIRGMNREDVLPIIKLGLHYLDHMAGEASRLAEYNILKHRPPRHTVYVPLLALGAVWARSTGRRPRVTGKPDGGLVGPFVDFVYSAFEPMWPKQETREITGLIRKACTELGKLGWR